jgi:hypothetical protein
MTLRLTRRGFVLSILALAPIALVGTAWIRFPTFRRAAIESLLSNIGGARQIGARYLDLAPEDSDPVALAARVFGAAGHPPQNPRDIAALRQAISVQRERDFATGDTVIIDGWILARTEARLCALTVIG